MSDAFAFLSNSLYCHVTLTELVMVGPGKLMVGHRPSRPWSGYATVIGSLEIFLFTVILRQAQVT